MAQLTIFGTPGTSTLTDGGNLFTALCSTTGPLTMLKD